MSTPQFRSVDARQLAATLNRYRVPLPASLGRAITVYDTVMAAAEFPERRVLDLTDEEVSDYVATISRHLTDGAVSRAATHIAEQAANEAGDALRDGEVNEIILGLRPRFDAAANVIHEAVIAGIHEGTTAEQILNQNETAIAIWKRLHAAQATLGDISTLRIQLSVQLGIAPTRATINPIDNWRASVVGIEGPGTLDYSIAFTAGDNWSTDGSNYVNYSGRGVDGVPTTLRPSRNLDWFKLATNGLRLNTTDEITLLLEQRLAMLSA